MHVHKASNHWRIDTKGLPISPVFAEDTSFEFSAPPPANFYRWLLVTKTPCVCTTRMDIWGSGEKPENSGNLQSHRADSG